MSRGATAALEPQAPAQQHPATSEHEIISVAYLATGPDPDLTELLERPHKPRTWVVPGVLAHRDRMVLIADEGAGKSTLLHQFAVQIAAGVHPFTHDRVAPRRVLLVDLENELEDVLRNEPGADPEPNFADLVELAGGRDAVSRRLTPVFRPEGLDLLTKADRAWLFEKVALHEPDVLIIGPIYKMMVGDPIAEEPVRKLTGVLDQLRTSHGLALVLEGHMPYGEAGRGRPKRLYGASYWMRWTPTGLHLAKDGKLTPFRPLRRARTIPARLRRDYPGGWPWVADDGNGVSGNLPSRYVGFMERIERAGRKTGTLTVAELARETGLSPEQVKRAKRHCRDRWDRLVASVAGTRAGAP